MRQETFLEERGARDFGRLVDTVGGAAARKVLEARRSNDDVPTLRTWTARYLDVDSGRLTGIEPGTRAEYERIAGRSFLRTLGDYPIDAIEKDDVGQWIAWQEKQPSRLRGGTIAAKTVRNYHALLSSVLAAACDAGLRTGNPAYRTRLSGGIRREGVFLTPTEFNTLLTFIPEPYKRFVLFLAGTGARWGEATAVMWGDLNLTAAPPTVRIDKAWKKSTNGAPVLKQPKSARSKRTISMFPTLVSALGEIGAADELVFPGVRSGGHLWYGRFRASTWSKAVRSAQDKDLCEARGVPVLTKSPNIHDLRHTHASWLIAAGVPLPYIQARLGHESITTTIGTYGHLVPDAHEQMATVISDTLSLGQAPVTHVVRELVATV